MAAHIGSHGVFEKPRSFPRPTVKCSSCQGDLILCWGAKVNPYLRHKSKINECTNDSTHMGESDIHKLCKNMIVSYLTSGNVLEFNSKCGKCGIPMGIVGKTTSCVKYQPEVPIGSSGESYGVFDVAGLDENNNVIFGIEVLHSHRTDNLDARNNFPWYEIRTTEIMNKLDQVHISSVIHLHDRRRDRMCNFSTCTSETVFVEPSVPQQPSLSQTLSSPGNSVTLSTKNENNIGNWRNYKKKYEYIESDISNETIAKRLGYLYNQSIYSHIIKRYLDEAMRGGYIPNWLEWYFYPVELENGEDIDGWKYSKSGYWYMWKIFLGRRKCLKCDVCCKISRGRPYCTKCYRKLKHIHDEGKEKLATLLRLKKTKFEKEMVKSDQKEILRTQLNFLNYIENKEEKTHAQCTDCTAIVCNEIWWFGKYKRICYDCTWERFERVKNKYERQKETSKDIGMKTGHLSQLSTKSSSGKYKGKVTIGMMKQFM